MKANIRLNEFHFIGREIFKSFVLFFFPELCQCEYVGCVVDIFMDEKNINVALLSDDGKIKAQIHYVKGAHNESG